MHKVASNSCMNTLAIFKALGKAKKIFCKYCSKAEPKFGLHQDRRNHLSLQKKSCQKSRKVNFRHQNSTQSCHYYRNPKLHSIASSIRNERNLLPYWSGSAVLKVKQLLVKSRLAADVLWKIWLKLCFGGWVISNFFEITPPSEA